MGDRGNVQVKENAEDNGVFFYTHWSGSDLPKIVSAALKRGQGRWGDTPYLARIIFCEMVKDEVLDETGFGISTSECDSGPLVIVNDGAQTVTIGDIRWSYKEFAEHGTLGTPLMNDPAKQRAKLYKCECCR